MTPEKLEERVIKIEDKLNKHELEIKNLWNRVYKIEKNIFQLLQEINHNLKTSKKSVWAIIRDFLAGGCLMFIISIIFFGT